MEHHGRIDDQVKIKVHSLGSFPTISIDPVHVSVFQGFRVELDGVTAALRNYQGVTQMVTGILVFLIRIFLS